MGVNSFLDNETTLGSFDANAADLWLKNKKSLDIDPTPNRDYVTAYEKAQLLSISGKSFDYMVEGNKSNTFTASGVIIVPSLDVQTTFKINGTQVYSTAAELNSVQGVTNGTAIASKAVILNSSKNVSGMNNLTSNNVKVASDVRLLNISGAARIIGDVAQDIKFQSSDNVDGVVESITDRIIIHGSSNPGYIGVQGLKGISGGNIRMKDPILFYGVGSDISGGVVNTAMSGNSTTAQYCTQNTRTMVLTTANGARSIAVINVSGNVLLPFQEINFVNKTSTYITLGHNVASSTGFLKCRYQRLYPNEAIRLLYDISGGYFSTTATNPNLFKFQLHRWAGDDMLNMFCNSTMTHHVKINCNNTSGHTINGVASWDNMTSSILTNSTTWLVTVSGSLLQTTSTGYVQTETQSAKMANFIHNFTSIDFKIDGMTALNYYMFMVWMFDTDGTAYARELTISDLASGEKLRFYTQIFTTNASGSPGTICSYIFRAEGGARTIQIINHLYTQINAFTVINLGSDFA